MITNRHLLPLFFAFACMVGMGWTCSGQGPLVDKNIQLDPGQAQELGPITLVEKGRYVLELELKGRPRHGFLADIELTVQRDGDEEALFELEDGYWAESGTWREGGESGTWYEKNGQTKLYFAAPKGGTYRFTIQQNNQSATILPVKFTINKKPYSAGAFLMGFILFMVITLIVFLGRARLFKMYIGQMGKGSVVKWNKKLWKVTDIFFYGEPNQSVPYPNRPGEYSIAYKLESPEGEERYLSIETFEYEWEDSEGDDYDATHDAILMSDVLSKREHEELSASKSNFPFRGKSFRADPDYSGVSTVYTEKEGMIFKSKVSETVFLSRGPTNYRGKGNARKAVGIPDDAGDPVISVARYEDGDAEWNLSLMLDWKSLKVKRMVARKDIDFNAGNAA